MKLAFSILLLCATAYLAAAQSLPPVPTNAVPAKATSTHAAATVLKGATLLIAKPAAVVVTPPVTNTTWYIKTYAQFQICGSTNLVNWFWVTNVYFPACPFTVPSSSGILYMRSRWAILPECEPPVSTNAP